MLLALGFFVSVIAEDGIVDIVTQTGSSEILIIYISLDILLDPVWVE